MKNETILSLTRSVSFSLETLEQNLDPNFLDSLLKDLQVDSITKCHVQADVINDGLTFYTIGLK